MDEERYAFEVTWYDNLAEITRRFMLMYFVRHTGSNEVEMIDLKTNKKFLKRCPYPSLLLKDLYVGGTVTIFSRQLQVVAFSDPFTQRTLGARQIKCLAVVSASALQYVGLAISEAQREGINVEAIRMVHLNGRDADEVAAGRPDLINAFRDTVVVMQLVGSDTPNVWSKVIARLPGGNGAFFGSINASDGDREVKLMFGPNACGSETATYDNCTLCVIKPHIVRDGKAGEVITAINEAGFQISAIKSFTLNLVEAEEFLEIYKGVLPEFNAYVEELSSGLCIALEVRAVDAVSVFRQFVGPHEVEIAKHLRPQTLRARFGKDKVKNAVHTTDLPEDGVLEVEHFFQTLTS